MATHIRLGDDSTLCHSRSVTAQLDGSSCQHCNGRLDKLLILVLDVIEATDDQSRRASVKALGNWCEKTGIQRISEEPHAV